MLFWFSNDKYIFFWLIGVDFWSNLVITYFLDELWVSLLPKNSAFFRRVELCCSAAARLNSSKKNQSWLNLTKIKNHLIVDFSFVSFLISFLRYEAFQKFAVIIETEISAIFLFILRNVCKFNGSEKNVRTTCRN